MKIRQAPIEGLVEYAQGLYENSSSQVFDNIFEIINKYYCSLSYYPKILPQLICPIEDLCGKDMDNSMITCPNIPGLIVYRDRNGIREYGLLYHSGYIVSKTYQTEYLAYLYINKNGNVDSHTFLASQWDGWGAPTRFFNFEIENYIRYNDKQFGERDLSLNCFGHDVEVLQYILKKRFSAQVISGKFDASTEQNVRKIQSIYGDFINGKLNANQLKDDNFLNFLDKGSELNE